MPPKKETALTFKIGEKELSPNDYLPGELFIKDEQGNPSLPVKLAREIARQLDIVQSVQYSDLKMIFKADSADSKGNPTTKITYERTCIIQTNDGKILTGSGSINSSANQMLGASAFGIISKINARAYKDALKHYARCFEITSDGLVSDEDLGSGGDDFFPAATSPQHNQAPQQNYQQPVQQQDFFPQQQPQAQPPMQQQPQQNYQQPMQQAPQQQYQQPQVEQPPVQQAPVQQAPVQQQPAPQVPNDGLGQIKLMITQTVNGVNSQNDISNALIQMVNQWTPDLQSNEELKDFMRIEYTRRVSELGG